MRERAFTLVEMLVVVTIILILGTCFAAAGWKVYEQSSLAVSANNIRQLAAAGTAYLAENKQTFWPYKKYSTNPARRGVEWWFGFETSASSILPEGKRILDPAAGPLGNYMPVGFRPDPSFKFTGKAMKPKYRSGYLGVGYNIHLGAGGYTGTEEVVAKTYWQLSEPSKVIVFATSAQVNTFQRPASAQNPMIEEYYAIDKEEVAVHFRHNGYAMVSYANGAAGFLPMDKSTQDMRAPKAQIGRFAPKGSKKYLE